ncbi:MAG TPA: Sua5/YciO/YrdC/YwlC family protein [Candidatus Dormibacteraeota bacterium]|nr:Sua5/YciO/YrdC/YwlC family protein [Candidatus Dormibacteraeota bacterium]
MPPAPAEGRPRWPATAAGIAAAASALRQGAVIAFPTDTVYGLAVAVGTATPAARLAAVKGRPLDQPAVLMTAGPAALQGYVRWTATGRTLARRHWPGPLTLILPAGPLAAGLGGAGSIGVRVPAAAVARRLLAAAGPCATTSANRHGDPPAPDAEAALAALPEIAGALDDRRPSGPGRGRARVPEPSRPSSILDCTRDPPVLIRVGALSAHELGLEAE